MDASGPLRHGQYAQLNSEFDAVQNQFERGEMTGDELRTAFRAFYATGEDLAPKYDQWVTAFPKSYVARVARAIYYKKRGLEERGGRFIEETSTTQIGKMDSSLGKAIRDFGDSIPLTPKPFLSYLHMLDIGRQYVKPSYSRTLYDRAIALDPTSIAARQKYMLSLSAKWGGGLADMQSFLQECLKAKLGDVQRRQLQSMVYEDEGFESERGGEVAAAEAAYKAAIDLGPPDCTSCIVTQLIDVLIRERKFKEAQPYLDAYLGEKPRDIWASSNRGVVRYELGDLSGAFADWSLSAVAGDTFSQNRLGVLYMTGIPGRLSPNAELGIDWLRKAARQGSLEASHNLSIALKQSTGPLTTP